jgi:nucleoside-diphosphate-sugar epimerase
MARVLVTGGTGFIGGHVVNALVRSGHQVGVLVRAPGSLPPGVRAHRGDLATDATLPPLQGYDAIVHAAALVSHHAPWKRHHAVNVLGTRRLLAAAKAAGMRRFVHVSSLVVLAPPRDGVWTESAPRRVIEPWLPTYVRAKLEAEAEVDAAEARGLEVVVARPGVVLGPGDRITTPQVLDALRRRLAATIGDGSNRFPCVCVEELAEALARAALEPGLGGLRVNLAARESPTQREFLAAHAVAAGLGTPRGSVPPWLAVAAAGASEAIAACTRTTPWLTRLSVGIACADIRVERGPAAAALDWRGERSCRDAIARAVAASGAQGRGAAVEDAVA